MILICVDLIFFFFAVDVQKTQNQAVVPRGSRTIARHGPGQADETVLAPTGILLRC